MTESTYENVYQASARQPGDIWTTLAFAREALIGLSLSIFLVSPLIQLFMRFFERTKVSKLQYPDLTRYENAIDATNKIIIIAAVTLFLCFIFYAIYNHFNREGIPAAHRISLTSWETVKRLIPFFLFVLFSCGILISTIIRGPNSWDMIGHWYMHESIYSYIIYALAYFLCAMLLWTDRTRKLLLYLLITTALPIHILSLVDEWGMHITYYEAKGLGTSGHNAVFFNSNHYGYYLMLTVLISALLYVHEKNLSLQILSAVCGIVASMVLIINNTLGAYLASLFVLILFVIFCIAMDRAHLKRAFIILGVFLLVTIAMSFRYNTILSSLVVLKSDIAMIAEDPLEADSAGSSRWRLWKETVRHIPDHPLVGFGVEGLLDTYGVGTPHNEFLQYAIFFGLPVMLYYVASCAVVLWRIFRNHKQMSDSTMICFFATIGYLASSFFGVTIFYTTPFLYILLGMTYAEYLKNGKQGVLMPDNRATADTEAEPAERDESAGTDTLGQGTAADTGGAVSNAEESISQSIVQAHEQGLEEGLQKGRREGAEIQLISMVCKKLQKGKTVEEIAADLDEDVSRIEAICEVAENTAPDYNAEDIYHTISIQ